MRIVLNRSVAYFFILHQSTYAKFLCVVGFKLLFICDLAKLRVRSRLVNLNVSQSLYHMDIVVRASYGLGDFLIEAPSSASSMICFV